MARYWRCSAYVPEMYEVGQTPDHLYIALEYLDGEDLATIIRRGPIDPVRAATIERPRRTASALGMTREKIASVRVTSSPCW